MEAVTPILLIWEEVPETIKTFCFDADEAMMKWLPLCHRKFVNGKCSKKVQSALDKLNAILTDMKPADDREAARVSGNADAHHFGVHPLMTISDGHAIT